MTINAIKKALRKEWTDVRKIKEPRGSRHFSYNDLVQNDINRMKPNYFLLRIFTALPFASLISLITPCAHGIYQCISIKNYWITNNKNPLNWIIGVIVKQIITMTVLIIPFFILFLLPKNTTVEAQIRRLENSQKELQNEIKELRNEEKVLNATLNEIYQTTKREGKESQIKFFAKNLEQISSLLPKKNGYPEHTFSEALEALETIDLTSLLLLIDAATTNHSSTDKAITNNQIQLIKKIKKMGGWVVVCCSSSQPTLKPELLEKLEDYENVKFVTEDSSNKLKNEIVWMEVECSCSVVVSGDDTNGCVRATITATIGIGANRDSDDVGEDAPSTLKSLLQKKIAILCPSACIHGIKEDIWKEARFSDSMFFWEKIHSYYPLINQAVIEYKQGNNNEDKNIAITAEEKEAILLAIKDTIFDTAPKDRQDIINILTTFDISPNDPILDEITS